MEKPHTSGKESTVLIQHQHFISFIYESINNGRVTVSHRTANAIRTFISLTTVDRRK